MPGTTIFDGEQARKGYALNKMCYSFNDAGNRARLRRGRRCLLRQIRPERASSAKPSATATCCSCIEAGGNAYYLAKFAGIFGLDMQDIGAQQTGVTKEQFKAKLLAARG